MNSVSRKTKLITPKCLYEHRFTILNYLLSEFKKIEISAKAKPLREYGELLLEQVHYLTKLGYLSERYSGEERMYRITFKGLWIYQCLQYNTLLLSTVFPDTDIWLPKTDNHYRKFINTTI